MRKVSTLWLVAVSLAALPLLAQEAEPDAEGCKDASVLSRMPGCRISSCDNKDFDSADIRTGPDEPNIKAVEGKVERSTYFCEDRISFLAMARNAEGALKRAGFTILYSGPAENTNPAVSARKGGIWVSIQTEPNGGQTYRQIVVHAQEMEQQMVADASAFEAEINKTGSCSIYGILFDTGKASIQPASAKCLDEVVKLLQNNGAWKMEIQGHTDNVGGKDANLKLSQARAESVRSWLSAHGIAAGRLTAKGFGDARPIGENTTEEGRSKNRRVTLTKL